jgi:DNA-binding PadR family transcriptional regulator
VPNKKLYSLTDNGRKEFKDWLEKSPEKKLLMHDPFMMRFVFFNFVDSDKTLLMIDEQIKTVEQILARSREEMPHWKEQGLYHFLSHDWGLASNELYLQWLHKARSMMVNSNTEKEDRIRDGSPKKKTLKFPIGTVETVYKSLSKDSMLPETITGQAI